MSKEKQKPLVLALDTSTSVLAAALVRGEEVLASKQSQAERNHSAHVVPAMQELIRTTGISPEELDGIAVGNGPGSYTGVRIAASVAKTLAWIWGCPIVGVSTLEALAVGAYRERQETQGIDAALSQNELAWIVPLLDARRGQAYTTLFAAEGESWSRLETDANRLMVDWARQLHASLEGMAEQDRPSLLLLTGDLERHGEAIELLEQLLAELPGGGPAVAQQSHVMEGRSIAWLGSRRLAGGEADDVHSFVPNYTQLVEAEVKLLEKSGEA